MLRVVKIPDRPNIRYAVLKFKGDNPSEIFSWATDDIEEHGYKARRIIIFCRSHNHCRTLFRLFDIKFQVKYPDYKTRPYAMIHAGTDEEVKDFVIKSLREDEGNVRIVFATTAFGMSIDCKGLHLVIHFGLPNNIDDYVQESGRAGRDNQNSHAVLILYPKCTSGKVSPEMKNYARNGVICKRSLLLKSFGHFVKDKKIQAHACCDICATSCKCETCVNKMTEDAFKSPVEIFVINKEILKKAKVQSLPNLILSDEGKKLLQKQLSVLRNSIVEKISSSFVGLTYHQVFLYAQFQK